MEPQYRFSDDEFEFREESGTAGVLTGVVMRYGEVSKLTPWAEESVERGAFKRLAENDWTVNRMHQRYAMLGRTGDNLTMIDDSDALRFRLEMPDSALGRETSEELRRRWLRGASIELGQVKAEFRGVRRVVKESTANSFAIVDRPAYLGSIVNLNRWEDWEGYRVEGTEEEIAIPRYYEV